MVGVASLITGIVTGGFGFLKEWWKGKQELSLQELSIRQEITRTKNELELKKVTAQLDIDKERVDQMAKSWKDEISMFIFYIPLFTMFLSPFADIIMLGVYSEGMLAIAAKEALTNLDQAPSWYIFIVVVMTMLNYGYEKGVDQIFSLISKLKK